MAKKLRCIVVDDDKFIHQVIGDLCKSSAFAEVTYVFDCPKEFIKKQGKLEYDICLLDLCMPQMDGILVAELLDGKPIIFISSVDDKLRDAVEFAPIDIVTKPIKKERLEKAFVKALKLLSEETVTRNIALSVKEKEYELFNIAEANEKMRLCIKDIFFVTSDIIDPRNKRVIMRNGEKYTLMDCNFEKILNLSARFVRVNRSEIVSIEAVQKFRHDVITLKCFTEGGHARQVTLNRSFREGFVQRLTI
jgi:DNA-binding LytR/AlgR family response regulator